MKVEFSWRDYDDYAKWLQDVLTTLYEENEQLKVEKVKLLSENQQLKKNRDKAIEYVEHHKFNKFGDIDCNEAEDIIDILKGDSDE